MENLEKQAAFKKWADSLAGCTGVLTKNAPIWFCGLERGGDSNPEREFGNGAAPNNLIDWTDSNDLWKTSPVDAWASKFICLHQDNLDGWRQFRRAHLYMPNQNGLETLKLNLFPFAKPSQSTESKIPEVTGYDSINDYYDACVEARMDRFTKLISEYKPKSMVCFGKTHWHRFIKVFDLPETTELPVPGTNKNFRACSKNGTRYYLTGFFGRFHMSSKIMHAIVDDMKRHS